MSPSQQAYHDFHRTHASHPIPSTETAFFPDAQGPLTFNNGQFNSIAGNQYNNNRHHHKQMPSRQNQVQSAHPWHHTTPDHYPSQTPPYNGGPVWPANSSHLTAPYPATHHPQATHPSYPTASCAARSPRAAYSKNHGRSAPTTPGPDHPPSPYRSNHIRSPSVSPATTSGSTSAQPIRPRIALGPNSRVNAFIHGVQDNRNQFNHRTSGSEYRSDQAVDNTDDDGDVEETRDSPSRAEQNGPVDDAGVWSNAQ
ncbi:hypothetical protein V5O48_018636, partial [Marasmius crinis-equi]